MSTLPIIAIVGRPNVGKSTLFNRLTKSRDAIVADYAGLTRDRQYGRAVCDDKPYVLVDTGGILGGEEGIDALMVEQVKAAIDEAEHVLFVVDAREGLAATDHFLADMLRRQSKPVTVVANKTDGIDEQTGSADFYQIGLGTPVPISASHGRGVTQLIRSIMANFAEPDDLSEDDPEQQINGICLGVVGRPNVGKSTLVNRMLGEERVVVYDHPGTTRDSIYLPLERDGQSYTLIDTAGVRRKGKVKETIEKFSIVKTLQAIEDANVIILMLDASEGIVEQDLHLIGHVINAGCALVVAVNKWDGLSQDHKQAVKTELARRLRFLEFARVHTISAKHGTGVGDLFGSVQEAYESAFKSLSTAKLNAILQKAVTEHQPPLVQGRRIKLRYAHLGGQNPPVIVVHGNQTEHLPDSYKRYLENTFRKALKLKGTPVRIELKTGDNPYAGKKNILSDRQKKRRKRLLKHVKK